MYHILSYYLSNKVKTMVADAPPTQGRDFVKHLHLNGNNKLNMTTEFITVFYDNFILISRHNDRHWGDQGSVSI